VSITPTFETNTAGRLRVMDETARSRFALLLALVGGTALRLWGLGAQSLTKDEITELFIARMTPREIIGEADGFPPLSQLILHAALKVAAGDATSRLLAVLYGILAIAVLWRYASELGGPRVGGAAALLLAASPLHVFYSQEGRAYALVFLLALLAMWRFDRALDTNRWTDWALYCLALLAGLYTHYYFALLIATQGIVFLAERPSGAVWRHALASAAALLLALLPWALLLRGDLAVQADSSLYAPFNPAAVGYAFFTFIAGYGVGPSTAALHVLGARRAALEVLPWALLAFGGTAVLGWTGLRALGAGTTRRRLLALAILPVILCGVLGAASGAGFRVRYVLWSSIPILIILAFAFLRSIRWPVLAATVGLAFVAAASIWQRRFDARYANEDLRALAGYLHQHADSTQKIYVLSGYMAQPVRHYLGSGWSVYRVRDDTNSPVPPVSSGADLLRRTAQPGEHIWLVYTRAFHGDPDGRYRAAIALVAPLEPRAEFAGIQLFEGVVR